MTGTMREIETIARRHGLSLDELRAVLVDTDAARGLLGPADLEAGLQAVIQTYLGVLHSAAERVIDPGERLVVDKFLGQAIELLAGQLSAAPHRPN